VARHRRRREFQHFALHHIGQAVDTHDTVGHRHHCALVTHIGADAQALDAALDQFRNFCGIELHDSFLLTKVCYRGAWTCEAQHQETASHLL
jgi:hypothetical protein